ncbi:hypothetical protein RY279_06735 [Bacillus velezensis]|uniref:hypothetical protein n=1 Tax=Bacillus velezensis TaxID=492670 RepID=UPI001C64F9E0|nr:hypothetical protein [Bacillus velezensis]MBW7978013.1 hypothetical protein [Bacillus velezensis]
MTEEVKRLRCAVADLIGENERLKNDMPRSILAMSNELCRIRQELMDLSADNWRLKTKINWLEEGIEDVVGLVYKHVDNMSELYAEAERLDDLKEALK